MKKIALILLLISSSFALHAMLPRTGVKVIARQMSTHGPDTTIDKTLCAVASIPAGWVGAIMGGALGGSSGIILGLIPSMLLQDREAWDKIIYSGALVGAFGGGLAAAYATASMRGVISCGATSATLYAIGQWNKHNKRNRY